MKAVPDYDGSVWVEGVAQEPFKINLYLSDEFRSYESFPVEVFNENLTIDFPFGRYYLKKDET